MKKIGLISDTHSYLDHQVFDFFKNVDEIWHAGDFGNPAVSEQLSEFKPLRGVYGNIDGREIRTQHPLDNRFNCEGLDVWMTHIGGYPKRYDKRVWQILQNNPPGLFICGHSHIVKVMLDTDYDMLVFNPGAAGKVGWQKERTVLRFSIETSKVKDMELIKLGKR